MPNFVKAIIGLLLFVVMLLAMGMVYVKDGTARPEYCANCHEDPEYITWSSPGFLAHDHAVRAVSCQNCHERTLDQSFHEIQVYSQDGYKSSSLQVRYDSEECTVCHGNQQDIAMRTENYIIDGEVHNPHNPHANLAVDDTNFNPNECYRCHEMHGDSLGTEYCISCHHTGEFIACSSSGCHDDNTEDTGTVVGF